MNKETKQLDTLSIRDVRHLCKHLHTSKGELDRICRVPEKYYVQRCQTEKGKRRHIATPHGRLRQILDRLQNLLQRISLTESIHARRGRSYITNAMPHLNKPMLLNMDLKDFFPSISHRVVYRMFRERLGCSPDVARYLTRLTTLNGSVPQGSPPSTIVAVLVSEPLAKRLEGLEARHGADYTQYVDNMTLSGPRHVRCLKQLVQKIARQEGFAVNPSKTEDACSREEQTVTGVRVNRTIDVPRKKLDDVRKLIESVRLRRMGGKPICDRELNSIKGKIRHVIALNRGAGRFLSRRLRQVLSPI